MLFSKVTWKKNKKCPSMGKWFDSSCRS